MPIHEICIYALIGVICLQTLRLFLLVLSIGKTKATPSNQEA